MCDTGNATTSESALERYDGTLRRFSLWFVTIHELLAYLPRRPIVRETSYTLHNPFGKHYTEQDPTVILGSIFNAFEFDFFRILEQRLPDLNQILLEKSRNIVLQLALCDRASPLTWPILAHEMGHAIDESQGISVSIARRLVADTADPIYELVRNWCKELFADSIAACFFGPSPILALVGMVYCVFPRQPQYKFSQTHPLTKWRLEVVSKDLSDHGWDRGMLQDEKQLYSFAWDYQLDRFEKEVATREDYRKWESGTFSGLITRLSEEVHTEVQKLRISHATIDPECFKRCRRRLELGSPIGAQGDSRETLRDRLRTYKARSFANSLDRKIAFQELLDEFKEDCTPVASVIYSGYVRRNAILQSVANEINSETAQIVIENGCKTLSRLDELLVSSLRISQVTANMRPGGQTDGIDATEGTVAEH